MSAARNLGFGIGLRPKHFGEALAGGVDAECVEIVAENFAGRGGRPRAALERVRRDCPVLVHAVGLDVAGFDPVGVEHVTRIRDLADELASPWVSDHLCWSRHAGRHGHDLWPVPRSLEMVEHVSRRIDRIQSLLGRPIALENVSAYVDFRSSELSEAEMWSEIFTRTGCFMLLDINNALVTATNIGTPAEALIDALPADRVVQIHLAGHAPLGAGLLDDHGAPVSAGVWELYERATERFGPVTTIIERDTNVPPASALLDEAARARATADAIATARRSPPPHLELECYPQ